MANVGPTHLVMAAITIGIGTLMTIIAMIDIDSIECCPDCYEATCYSSRLAMIKDRNTKLQPL